MKRTALFIEIRFRIKTKDIHLLTHPKQSLSILSPTHPHPFKFIHSPNSPIHPLSQVLVYSFEIKAVSLFYSPKHSVSNLSPTLLYPFMQWHWNKGDVLSHTAVSGHANGMAHSSTSERRRKKTKKKTNDIYNQIKTSVKQKMFRKDKGGTKPSSLFEMRNHSLHICITFVIQKLYTTTSTFTCIRPFLCNASLRIFSTRFL